MKNMQTFADWLRDQMAQRSLTLRQLEDRTEVNQSLIGRWLRAEAVPRPPNCNKLARALGLPPEEVLRVAGHLPPLPEAPIDPVPPGVRFSFEGLADLAPEERAEAEEVGEAAAVAALATYRRQLERRRQQGRS